MKPNQRVYIAVAAILSAHAAATYAAEPTDEKHAAEEPGLALTEFTVTAQRRN